MTLPAIVIAAKEMYATKPISHPMKSSPIAATANMMMLSGAAGVPNPSIMGKSTTVIASAKPTRKYAEIFILPKNGDMRKIPLIRVSESKNAAICPCSSSYKSMHCRPLQRR